MSNYKGFYDNIHNDFTYNNFTYDDFTWNREFPIDGNYFGLSIEDFLKHFGSGVAYKKTNEKQQDPGFTTLPGDLNNYFF